MNNPFRAYARSLLFDLRRIRALSSAKKLLSHPKPRLREIAGAILDTIEDNLTSDERVQINKIERRRLQLLTSNNEISYVDYGAGSRGTTRTQEQMIAGVEGKTTVGKIAQASKPPFWAKLLMKLIGEIDAKHAVELGACVGLSAAYQALALKNNGSGRLFTLEGSPTIAQLAKETLEGMELPNTDVVVGPFQKTLAGILKTQQPVDYFFNDGHHDKQAVLDNFELALPYLTNNAVVVVDDINWSKGMREAWRTIERHPKVSISINLREMGIAVISTKFESKDTLRIPL